jgi:hypothetical protein
VQEISSVGAQRRYKLTQRLTIYNIPLPPLSGERGAGGVSTENSAGGVSTENSAGGGEYRKERKAVGTKNKTRR